MVKIGFIGCHESSWFCLKKICELARLYNDNVALVFNLNEEEASKHSASFSFDELANEYGFNLIKVSNVATSESLEILDRSNLDILFIIGWHRIVPKSVLDKGKIKLGIHSSILPKDRGSSPINWQIIRGNKKGGVTLFHLTDGVDAGNIVDFESFKIESEDDVRTVYFKATVGSLNLLENNWEDIHNLTPKSIVPDESIATQNERRKPEDGLIDWSWSTLRCQDWIRALTKPYPGAYTYFRNKKVFLWKSRILNGTHNSPGTILESDKELIIATADGSIEISLLQAEGEPICNGALFSKIHQIKKGECFS